MPNYVSDEDLIIAVDTAMSRLAYKFRFGYHTIEDIKQEAYVMALTVLRNGKWDETRPLSTFMYVHLHNRLYNFKRDNYSRLSKPCDSCPLHAYVKCTDHCLEYSSKDECTLYAAWLKRNNTKKSLMHCVPIDSIFGCCVTEGLTPSEVTEYLDYIERAVCFPPIGPAPPPLIDTWRSCRAGEKFNSGSFAVLTEWIRENVLGELDFSSKRGLPN